MKLEKARSERAVADVAVAASEDDASKSCHAKSGTAGMRQQNAEPVRG